MEVTQWETILALSIFSDYNLFKIFFKNWKIYLNFNWFLLEIGIWACKYKEENACKHSNIDYEGESEINNLSYIASLTEEYSSM